MLVKIVAVANRNNTGLDLDRLQKVEDIHPEIAQKMLDGGTAVLPTSEELAAYREAQQSAKTDTKPTSTATAKGQPDHAEPPAAVEE